MMASCNNVETYAAAQVFFGNPTLDTYHIYLTLPLGVLLGRI